MPRPLRSFALIALFNALALAQQPAVDPAKLADPGPSLLAIPIRINLEPIFQAAERTAPKTPPGVETWTPLPDARGAASYRFNLYREPLAFRLNGSRLLVRTTVQYWLEVGVGTGQWIKGVGACGQGPEGFRRALLSIQADLSLTSAWRLDLKTTALDPLPITPCDITFLGYDITDKVVSSMRDNLAKATQSMEQQVRDNAMLRQKAEAVWMQIQQPVEVSPGIFLLLNPERIRLAPWRSEGKVLVITPEIQARPAICFGQPPAIAPRPLPDLEILPTNTQSNLKVRVDADLPFEQASAQLRRQLAGKTFETEKGTFQVLDASVRGQDGKALLSVDLKGKVNGRLTLVGRPIFNSQSGTLQLQDLDYTLESKSWITHFGEWVFRSTLRKTLAEKADWFMDKSLKDLKEQVRQGLNRPLVPGINLSGNVTELKPGQPQVLGDRFRLDAVMEGAVQIDVAGLPGI